MTPYDAKQPVIDETCPRCGAQPGEWCSTPTGNLTPWQHAGRYANFHKTSRETAL